MGLTREQTTELKAEFRQSGTLAPDGIQSLLSAYDELLERNEKLWDALHTAGKVVERVDNVGNNEQQAQNDKKEARRNSGAR